MPTPPRTLSAIALSVLAHLVVALGLALAPIGGPSDRAIPFEVEIVMEIPEAADIPPETSVEPPSDVGVLARPAPRPVPRPRTETTERPEGVALDGIVTADATALDADEANGTDVEAPRTPLEEARIRWAIDPRRIAEEMVLDEDPGPSVRGEPAGGGDRVGGLSPEVELLSEAEAEARHSGHLAAMAALRDWLSETPIEPRERPDGTWVWEGPLFTATIERDGSIHYDDRPPASVDFSTASVAYDLEGLLMRAAGLDPYQAEHQRFEEETEDLVLRLEDEHMAREIARDVRILRGRLIEIWGDVDRPAVSRRRAIFGEWDENDDGPRGRARQAAVVEFVREELPFGSEHAYSEAELGALNALRTSAEAFDPY